MSPQDKHIPDHHASPTIRLNTFEDVKGPAPAGWTAREQIDVTWPELCDRLEALTRRTARVKTKLPAFTLGTLTDAYAIGKNYANHTALVIDVDKCPQETLDALDALGVSLFAYASPSDPNPDGTRRVRIVAELSAPIAPGDVEHARFALAEMLGIGPGCGVETAKAVAQMMFAGRMHGSPSREIWRTEGEPLDAPALVSTPLTLAWRKTPKLRAVQALERVVVADPDERTAKLLEALAPHWAELEAHREPLRGMGGYLARRGWPDEQIGAVAVGLAPDRPVTNRVATMLETARAARLDDNAAGWPTLVEWSPDAAAVIESVAKDPREPDNFPGVWAPCLAKMFGRSLAQAEALKARKKAEADAKAKAEWQTPAANTAGSVPKMILRSNKGGQVITLLFEGDARGYRPQAERNLRLRIKELGYHNGLIPLHDAKSGKPFTPDRLAEDHGATYIHTAYAFANRVTTYDPTGEGSVLIGYPLDVKPGKFDAAADAWLRALAGAHYDRLAVWIASCSQVNINRLSACLIVMGRADSGKSMLGHAVALMWGQTPPALALITVQFNADLLRCPILVDEEAQLLGSKELSTKKFRDVIQSAGRSVEHKGLERCQLHGGLRAVVSCNGYSDLKFKDLGGPAVIEALRDRMLVLDATERTDACKAALAPLRLPNDHRVDLERVASHLAWLCETVALPVERFLGAGGDDSEAAILSSQTEEDVELWETFRDWLEAEAPGGAWLAHGGKLCAEPKALAMALERTGKGWALPRVRAALAPFATNKHYQPRVGGERPRLWMLDGERVAKSLGLGTKPMFALSRKLKASLPPAQPRKAGRFGRAR